MLHFAFVHAQYRSRQLVCSWAFVLSSQSFLSRLVINCRQHFLGQSDASKATIRHWGNIYKLYRLYTFLREEHHFVLYILNGKATLWHKLHKLYSFLTVNQQPNKYCLQKQPQPNHAEGVYGCFMTCNVFLAGNNGVSQFGVAVFYSRANHIHSVWVRCPGMLLSGGCCKSEYANCIEPCPARQDAAVCCRQITLL